MKALTVGLSIMRALIITLSFFICKFSYSQNNSFRAQVIVDDSLFVSGAAVIFPLSKDTIKIVGTGPVDIDLSNPKHLVFYFNWFDWSSKVYRLERNSLTSELHRISIPDTAFYKSFEERRICPICLKSKYLIPIVYGYPLPEEFKLAERGKIKLGGCVYDIQKKYHCRKDEFNF